MHTAVLTLCDATETSKEDLTQVFIASGCAHQTGYFAAWGVLQRCRTPKTSFIAALMCALTSLTFTAISLIESVSMTVETDQDVRLLIAFRVLQDVAPGTCVTVCGVSGTTVQYFSVLSIRQFLIPLGNEVLETCVTCCMVAMRSYLKSAINWLGCWVASILFSCLSWKMDFFVFRLTVPMHVSPGCVIPVCVAQRLMPVPMPANEPSVPTCTRSQHGMKRAIQDARMNA